MYDTIIHGNVFDVLPTLESGTVQCCVTSPPYYGLRNYNVDEQIGLEETPEEYVDKMVAVFREVRRVLRDDGTLWLNLGDTYNHVGAPSLKPKDLIGIPWRVAFALQADGWYLRQDIIWCKPNVMPESVTDRCTKAHEYIFLLTKSARYYYDTDAISEPAVYPFDNRGARSDSRRGTGYNSMNGATGERRNKRSVWIINTEPYRDAHFAVFPKELPRICILAGSKPGDLVLDPFAGSGTTLYVAKELGRRWLGIELNPEYCGMARKRVESIPDSLFKAHWSCDNG